MDELKLPADTKLAGKVLEGHIRNEQTKIDRGKIGDLFGSRNSIPSNIAALISLFATAVLLVVVLLWSGTKDFSYKDGVAAVTGLISLGLGYLFGRATKD